MNIFNYPEAFLPDYIMGIDLLVFAIGYNNDNLDTSDAKKDGMSAINTLLKLDVLYIQHWGERHAVLKDKDMSIEEMIEYIDKIWFEGAKYPLTSTMRHPK